MRRLRREGEVLDVTLTKLGQTVDDVFSESNVAEVRNYELALSSLERQGRQTFNSLGRNAREAELQTVGSIRRMDVSVALFRENLDRLDHAKATPTIDLDGISEAVAQVELLEKRLNSLSRRTATPRVGIPQSSIAAGAVTRAATPNNAGGGSLFSRGLKIPGLGAIPAPLVAGALAAAPPLIGTTTALGGSLGGAALGAGSIGLGAAGVGAAAIGMTAPIAISSIHGVKEAAKALESYRKEVIKSGVNSEAAKQKYRLYNMELEKAPAGAARLLRAKEGLVEDFRSSTRPAQAGFTGILTRGLNLGRQLTPLYSQQANQFFGTAQPQVGQYADFLNSGSSRQFYEAMGGEATKALRPTENIAENVTSTLMSLTRASRPFFREGLHFLDDWTGGWRRSSRDVKGVRDDMRGWVGELKTWGKLTGATFELLADLGSSGSSSGDSLVSDLTHQLEVWDNFVQRNPREVRNFFHESVESTEKLAEAAGRIFGLVWKIGRELGPLLDQFSELITMLDNAGLLSAGGLPLLLGAGRGTRAIFAGRGGATTGTTTGAPLILGGGAAGGAAAAEQAAIGRALPRGATYGLARDFGYGRIPSAAAEAGAALRAPASRFAGGFARGFGPYAALSLGLGALGTQGDAAERLQGGLSQATLGLVAMPPSGPEKQEEGERHARMVTEYQAKRFGEDPAGLNRQLLGLRRKIHALGIPTRPGGLKGFLTQNVVGGGGPTEISDEARIEAEALSRRRKEIALHLLPEAEIGEISGAFGIRSSHMPGRKKGESREEFHDRRASEMQASYQRSLSSIEGRVDKLHGHTRDQFAQMGVDWAKELAKANPKLRHAYNEMLKQVEERLQEAGRQVRIINGNIVDTSAKSWGNVADLIGTETQRAYAEANKNLTALEKRALTILHNMGYTNTQAQSIMHEAQTGRPTKAGSEANAQAHHMGRPGATVNNMPPARGKNAAGGRLPMPANGSLHDDVYLGNGQWGAGNELMVNRHTERRVDRVLSRFGTTLGREVAHENRAHSQSPAMEYNAALGARLNHAYATRRLATGGGIIPAARLAEQMGMGVSGGPGPGGGIPSSGHVGDSLHYSGLAYDVTGSAAQMRRYFFTALKDFRGSINELFYDPIGWYIDQGHKVPGAIGGHSDHVHIGFFPAGAHWAHGRGGGVGARGPAGAGQQIHLGAPHSNRRGVAGAAVNAAGQMEAGGLEHSINHILKRRGGGGGPLPPAAGGSRSAVERQIAKTLFGHGANKTAAAGIIGNAYAESSMDPTAEGTGGGGLWGFTSGAISLANLKAAGGSNWGNPAFQTQFMLAHGGQGLIGALNRAGSPEEAARLFMEQWERPGIPRLDVREGGARTAFRQGYGRGGHVQHGFAGWFAGGGRGRVSRPTLIGVGEAGMEDVEITPTPKRGRAGGGVGRRPIEVNVSMGHVSVHGAKDTEKVGKEIGRHAARELTKALAESDDVSDLELVGG